MARQTPVISTAGRLCLTLGFLSFFFSLSNSAFSAPQTLPAVETYDQLLAAIRGVRSASTLRIEQAVDREKVREAWETGQLIEAHVLLHKKRADYGQKVILRLSGDLQTSDDELYRMLEFYRAHPISAPARKLSWSHESALLAINDAGEREVLAERAEQENWTRDRVREEVKKRKAEKNSNVDTDVRAGFKPARTIETKPGKPYTYRVVKAAEGPYKGKLALDLGFANWMGVEAAARVLGEKKKPKLKEGDIVSSHSLRPASGLSLSDLYTYHAYVTQVIDADTIWATVDLGFGVTTHQRLRLNHIDAPEIESREGKEAKAFLEKILPEAPRPVLIKTSLDLDNYGRYLVDLFVNGEYVNAQLVDEGLALVLPD